MDEQLTCRVEGLVQGVGFRYFVYRKAAERNLNGWVRNNADGSVELLAVGPRAELELLVEAVRRGPRSAMVRSVTVDWTKPSSPMQSFEIR